jgi:putative ABC transport system substrate-binding protein
MVKAGLAGSHYMRRRDFIRIFGSAAAAWPLVARAQQQRAFPVIGLLSSRSPTVDPPLIAVIRQGLSESGFVEGQNIAFDYRWAEGQYDRLAGLAAELVRQRVAVIITMGGELSALAAKAATSTIPIVFAAGADPIRTGLAASLYISQAESQVSDIQAAAQSIGQDINILNARTIRDIDAAFATLAQMRADALLVATDPFFFTRATQLVVLSARHAIPTLYSRREFAAAGGLLSYGPNQDESYRLLGVYAARILKGEKPGDLPIQLPTKFDLVINLSTANALGLEIPPTLLANADEVIE